MGSLGQPCSSASLHKELSPSRAHRSTGSTRVYLPRLAKGRRPRTAANSRGNSSSSWSFTEQDADNNMFSSEEEVNSQSERHSESQSESECSQPVRRPRQRAGVQDVGDGQELLHAPYSHLLWCETTVIKRRSNFSVSRHLCTDIDGISTSDSSSEVWSGTAVQVTVLIHPASWDEQQYVCTQLQLEAPAGQQQQGQTGAAAAGAPGPRVFGPYAATLRPRSKGLVISNLQHQHEPQTCWQYIDKQPHRLVVQERVLSPGPPHFKLHIKPGQPETPRNQYALVISRAGEAPGLQVAPGSVTEVTTVGGFSKHGRKAVLMIPKVLSCSQLPPQRYLPPGRRPKGGGTWPVGCQVVSAA